MHREKPLNPRFLQDAAAFINDKPDGISPAGST